LGERLHFNPKEFLMDDNRSWYLIEAIDGNSDRWLPCRTFEPHELEEAKTDLLRLNPIKKEVRLLKVTQTREIIG
jgi:hypothetical protein